MKKLFVGHLHFSATEMSYTIHCYHEYHQNIEEMVLRPKTQAEIEAAAGKSALAWI